MLNTWQFNIIGYLVLSTIFTQFYKIATSSSKNDGALTIILQFLSGIMVLIFMPLFKFQVSTNIKTYIFLAISCVFYAISDRVNTTARRGLDVSVYSILSQLSTVFIIIWGILFFKEKIILNKLLGAILIIFGNILVLYKKGKFEWNKYVLFSLLGNISLSIGISVDVGISEQFNLPIYVASTLIVPSLMLFFIEKIKIKDVINELKIGNKKAIFTIVGTWGLALMTMLRAYQFGNVTTIASLCAVSTIINVFVAYILLREKENLPKKVISAIIVILGIILTKI